MTLQNDDNYFPSSAPVEDRNTRGRNWVFTWNNYSEENIEALKAWELPLWIIFGKEVAPTTGTPHLQGAFVCANALRWTNITRMFPGMWVQVMRGSPEQAADYCTKSDDDFYERGARPRPKGRAGGEANKRKWEEAKQKCVEGKIDEIEASIYIPYYKSLLAIQAKHQRPPEPLDDVCGIWYYGKTGTGKSHAAREEFPGAYLKLPTKWWCGYAGEDNVLVEDVDTSHALLGYGLKIWADKYPFSVEVKGSSMCIRPKRIIVTSNYHPKQIWTDQGIIEPIMRRFKITHFKRLADIREEIDESEYIRAAYVPGFVPYQPVLPEPIEIQNPLWNENDNSLFNNLYNP